MQAFQRVMESDEGSQPIHGDGDSWARIANPDGDGYVLVPEDLADHQAMQRPLYLPNSLAIQQMCRRVREYPDIPLPFECTHLNRKRDAFTPRLGR